MTNEQRDGALETTVGVAGVLTAGGVLTFALFPFLLGALLFVAPFGVLLLPLVLIPAVLAPLYFLAKILFRVVRRRPQRPAVSTPRRPQPAPSSARPSPS